MKHIPDLVLVLALIFSTVCNGQRKSEVSKVAKTDEWNKQWRIKDYKVPDVDSETENHGIIIQNSFPQGDGYTDSSGQIFGIAIFFTRIINLTENSLELTVNFPGDSITINSSPGSYLKLFLPPDTMKLDKVLSYGYGLTDLKSTLDTGLNSPSVMQRTINAKEHILFYVGILSDQVPDKKGVGGREAEDYQKQGGVTRTGVVLKDKNLFYKITIDLDSILIPCGQIDFKK